jgi:Beta-ketoacyl synthase, N-terminal domain
MASHPNASLFIEGVGFWTPALAGWTAARAVLRGEERAPSTLSARPSCALLAPTERRRAPDTVAVALEVAGEACRSAGRDPGAMACVFASTHGDLAISDYMCTTLAHTPTLISPTKFHNSVHNAAAGYWTIATGSNEPYTAITAYQHTFGAGWLTAATQALADAQPVLYVAYDIQAKGALAAMARSQGLLGAALVLAGEESASSVARIGWRIEPDSEVRPTQARPQNAALAAGNALADCIAFFEALADGARRELVLSLAPQLALHLEVEPRH